MNLFKNYLSSIKKIILNHSKELDLKKNINLDNIIVENPPEKFDLDFSSNVALILSKISNKNPREIAENLKNIFKKELKDFEEISIAGPGFINFKLSSLAKIRIINNIFKKKINYGSNKNNKKYNVEFVSANPTGPLHVGHCRGAVFGDVLSNLLIFNGNSVTKEFYVNDYGNQIDDFTSSVYFRLREIKFRETFPKNKNLYPGTYIIDIAKNIFKNNPKINLKNYNKVFKTLKKDSLKLSMKLIKNDLKDLGINHDYFFSETKLVKSNLVDKIVKKLKKDKFVEEGFLEPPKGEENKDWKKIKRLIFKSTLFGDDTNRALQKNDGTWTYFANDVAYHSTKVSKNYDFLINILGADHTGYVKRISSAVSAMSKNKIKLICKICQLVKLFKNGAPYKMSKRQGDFISIKDVLNEVGKDSVRFMMLNRGNDVELDFDFDKVLEKSKENPVFYVQYSYARINSLFRSAKIDLRKKINLNNNEYSFNIYETKLLRKIIEWPKIIEISANKLEPHRIPFYLYELATIFHSYWSKGNEDENYKFIKNNKINKLISFKLFQLTSITIENGMKILGVSLPKKM